MIAGARSDGFFAEPSVFGALRLAAYILKEGGSVKICSRFKR